MHKLLIVSAALSLTVSACRGSDDNNNTPDGGGDPAADAAPGSSTTIFDVQSDDTSVGSSVSLRSVVVTAIDTFGGRTGGFYVQESAGGAFSGVFVFGASAAGLAVGDLVNIDGGVKDEFSFNFDDGHSITQVVPPDGGAISVTKVGSGTVPEPEVLNPWDLAASDAEAEKWEGVLVRFNGVRALGSAFNVSQSDATLMEMQITGPFRLGGSLAQLDTNVVRGDCFGSVTGIGDYFFNYKVLPRSGADMVRDASGASCLPPEDDAALCSDGLDNNYDGFADCADFSCQDTVAECTVDTTVVGAQDGSIEENTRIRLTDVVVTAVSRDNKKFWVQDSGGAAALNGLYVFRPGSGDELPATVVPGRVVTIVGNLDEFDGALTELTNVTIEDATGAIVAVEVLDGIALSTLRADAQYEGVVVSIPGATVVTGSAGACTQFCNFTIGSAGNETFANDDIFRHTVSAGQCYGTFDGIMHYDTFADRIVVLPLEDGLTLGGGTCP